MGKLSLPSNPTAKSPIPKIRAIELPVIIRFVGNSVLQFQRDHCTNSDHTNLSLSIDPLEFAKTPVAQSLLCNDLARKVELDFDYSKIPAGSTDAQLLGILETDCFSLLREELDQAEVLLAKSLQTKCIPKILGRTRGLAQRLTGNPALVEDKGDLGEHVNPFIVEGAHALLDWQTWIQPVVAESLGAELPAFKFVTRCRQIHALAGLLAPQKKKVYRHRLLIGKIGSLDYSGISHALLAGIDDFMTQLQMGVVGRMFQDSGITRAHAECVNDIENMARCEKVERQNRLRLAASVVVENLGGDAERLRLAVEQEIFFTKILYEQIGEYLGAEIQKVVGCQADAVRPLDNAWHNFSAGNQIGPSDAPSLLALRANGAVRTFFSGQEWFEGTGISRRPTTSIVVEFEVINEAGAVEPSRSNEFLIIENVCQQPLSPRVNGFSVSLAGLHHETIHNEEGEPPID